MRFKGKHFDAILIPRRTLIMNTLMDLQYKSPDLLCYEDRLKTFELWSPQIQPDKFQLSSAGFYYTGRNDTVECFSCALRLHQWQKNEDPLTEHREHSKNCLFLKIIGQLKSTNPLQTAWSSWSPGFQNGSNRLGGLDTRFQYGGNHLNGLVQLD
jgi:hypothetical protein